MTTIYNQSNFKIQKKYNNTYTIRYNNEDTIFFSSLVFKRKFTQQEINDDTTTVTFNAKSVETLKQMVSKQNGYLSYNDVVHFIHDIGTQCVNQEKKGVIFSGINKDRIIVIDDIYYVLLDTDIYAKTDENTFTLERTPFKNEHSSPELLSLATLPNTLHRTSWMYSLASLCIDLLFQQHKLQNKRETEIKTLIESIQDTKLYFCLLRMLQKNPMNRKFLFV